MKTSSLILAGLLLTAGAAQAQLHRPPTIVVGVKAGGTASQFVGADARLENPRYGFHAGLAFHLGEWQGLSVQPELLYSQKGSTQQESFYDLKRRLTYLDVPVPVRYQSGNFFGEAGPQLGFLLSASLESSQGGEATDIKDNYRTLDVGYLLGVGYQPARGGFGVGLRYNGAFMRAPQDVAVAGQPTAQTSLRNSAFQAYASYFLKSRRRR